MTDDEKIDKFIDRHRMYDETALDDKRNRTRGNGEGSIRKRADGTFEGRVTIGWDNKKQLVKSVYAKTRKECNDKMQAVIKDTREHNIVLTTNSPTLGDWLLVWLKEYRKDLGDASRHRYIVYVEKMNKALAEKKIAELLPIDLQQYVNSFTSYETAKRALGFLRAALQDALNNGFTSKNPAAGLRNPIPPPENRFDESKKSFTIQEEQAFLTAIQDSPYRLIYQISLLAGLRRGEATALHWDNIDLVKRQITVKEAAKRGSGKGYSIGKTKTAAGLRTVPISNTLYEILMAIPDQSGFVCPNKQGKMLNADILTMDFAEIMKRLNMQHTFHHLRHTFATRCVLDKGIHPKVVQSWMGHATVDMTMNTYTHATDDLIQTETQKLN